MPSGPPEPDPRMIEEISRWRTQAMTRWAAAVGNSLVAEELRLELASVRESYENLLKERDILLDQVAALNDYIAALKASTSWRATRPLRFLSGLLVRNRGAS